MKILKALSYTGTQKETPPDIKGILNNIQIAVLIGSIAVILLRWFYKFMIWPDSANYLGAAINFVKHGKLFIHVNWPSGTFLPTVEPYTGYPPGFPLYLSFFVSIFNDPLVAAAIAQSIVLVTLALLIYQITVVLDFIPTIRIATLLFYIIFKSFTELQTGLLTEPLYISLTMGVFLCALHLWEKSDSKIWVLSYILIFLSGTVRWNGFANAALLLLPIWKHRKSWILKLTITSLAGVLPNIIWFLRNLILHGDATRIYKIDKINWEKIPTPFTFTVTRWGFGSIWILLAILAVALSPLYIKKLREKINLNHFSFISLEVFVQFLGIYILTLLVDVNPIDDRYLAPSYTYFVFLLFFSISTIIRSYKQLKFLIVVPWIFFIISLPAVVYAVKKRPITWIGSFTMPAEKKLWDELKKKDYYARASHFYTDENYVHQLFVEKPQRIVFPSRIIWTDPLEMQRKKITSFWSLGTKPIFVVAPNTQLLDYFENKGGLTPDVKKEFVQGFWIFYKE